MQPLPGGRRLVVDSNRGAAFEIEADGTEVWRYRTPRTNEAGRRSSIRMEHLAPELVDDILRAR